MLFRSVAPEPRHVCTSSQPSQNTGPDTISIHTSMEALDFLLAKSLIPTRQPITYDNLATVLLHITEAQKIPRTLEEAIYSISILLTDLTDCKPTLDVSTSIHDHLLGVNGTLCSIIKKLEDPSTDIKLTSVNLSDTTVKLRNDNNNMAQKLVTMITSAPPPPPNALHIHREQHPIPDICSSTGSMHLHPHPLKF